MAPVCSTPPHAVTVTPGKVGGIFDLAMGGKLTVPERLLNKKDSITCDIVSPGKRLVYAPNLGNQERLHSEIFKVNTSYNQTKEPIFLEIPHESIDNHRYEINVMGLWVKEKAWVNIGFLAKKDADQMYAELSLHRGGMFVVTCLRKSEAFEFTPNGCLYTSRLCRGCTLRCPRKASTTTISCSLEVHPISAKAVQYCQENYPFICSDLLDCVEIINVISDQIDDFRRPVTIKLPVPNANDDNHPSNEIQEETEMCVLMKNPDDTEWTVLQSTNISSWIVSVDVKRLGMFCVVKTKEGRQRRMKAAVATLEEKCDKIPGCISLFASFEEKLWKAVVACYPRADSYYHEKRWESEGYQKVNPMAKKEPEKTTHFDIPGKRHEFFKYNDPEFYDGLTWTIEVEGDFKLIEDTENENRIQFYSCLREHYYFFKIAPSTDNIRPLIGQVTVTPECIKDEEERSKLSGIFTLDISLEQVDRYLYVEPPPKQEEPLKKKPSLKRNISLPPTAPIKEIPITKKGSISKTRKIYTDSDPMGRLTKTVRVNKNVPRESRVLSGRSLSYLSRVEMNGLNLATYLGLTESCVTGLVFDALATGISMNEITYKILMYWKRHQTDKCDGAVNKLVLALQELGKPDVATIIMRCHIGGLELEKDSFDECEQ